MRRVDFRRHAPATALLAVVEHYWFIDWDLDQPYAQHVVGHPAVNLVIMRMAATDPVVAEIAGPGRQLFSIKLAGRGWVRGVQFRPGGFGAFSDTPPATLIDRRLPLAEVLPGGDAEVLSDGATVAAGVAAAATDSAAVAVLDDYLQRLRPRPSRHALRAIELAGRIRHDRTLTRVDMVAAEAGVSARSVQRLFLEHLGVGPKQVILRYRVHEAIERATDEVDWAAVGAELGYSDQAHLVRDVTAAMGMSPAAYAASLRREE
ncbi:helix-turn-helix domain-containing protein [Mangrovihabitans endophyticus]|uniref:AraC family transcriptional regulator n=1 Tax=Mangrovihabitans endophyticus TaxID=1751298 RepID=A0A8J3C2G1_9ACTN|nr:helix-turn-helix domain-containing protein [Mangrovihabitans endophyticus]GGL08086.1 AraC family transcriptional regulator [Mangrovihabitans endophyticus]